jgi:hypothetical protein
MSDVIKRWVVRSYTKSGTFYEITLFRDGLYECTCPSFENRRTYCKHIYDVVDGKYTPVYVEQSKVLERRAQYISYEIERLKEAIAGSILMGEPIDVDNMEELVVAAYYYGAIHPPSIFITSELKEKDG